MRKLVLLSVITLALPVLPIASADTKVCPDDKCQDGGIHACGVAYAMRGFRADHNLLLCERVVSAANARLVTSKILPAQSRNGMQYACPEGMYMRGIHLQDSKVICSQVEGSNVEEEHASNGENGNDQDHPTGSHACQNPDDDDRAAVITGVNPGNNVFLCAYITKQ